MRTRIKQRKTPLTREERIEEIIANLSSTIRKERAKEHGNKTLIDALVKRLNLVTSERAKTLKQKTN
jgi:hypothetical protein|tara:strand:+ start:384 stop:584 length:201 start_codon:yes stop_codon:yes gene_type:complete